MSDILVDDIILVLQEVKKIQKKDEKNDDIALYRKRVNYNAK